MMEKTLSVSEARKRFSRRVEGVARGGSPLTITQHGRQQAAIIGIKEYQELSHKAQAFEKSRKKARPFTLRGSLKLCCSPEQLVEEMDKIRALWTDSIHRSSEKMAREIARK